VATRVFGRNSYQAADLGLEGSLLAGVLGGYVSGLLGGLLISVPAVYNGEYLTVPLLASGFLWNEDRQQLARKPLVMVEPQGKGFVVAFTGDPNFRGYVDGMNLLFLNAVFRGPAHVH
jgi:hypothetical protein